MSVTKLERDKQKLVQDKCQQILTELLRDDDNKYCVDCDSKGPRWASWNLGIFLCIRCAGIHRNLGVHISKVKSVNLDSWTPEQVGRIQNMGNSKARAVYEANLPDNFSRPQSNSALEKFIRSKYEQKKFIAKEWVETTSKPAFDIETEIKKEKEKKKSKIKTISPIVQTDIQSNPIPRPTTSVNGKTEKVQAKPEATTAASTDLLGLDLGSAPNDEPFGFFTSAETPKKEESTESQAKQTKSLDEEEKDFFSQKVPDQSEKKKLTKESILSLYSQAPSSNQPNGFMPPQTLQTNSLNQFNSLNNKPFGAAPPSASQTNVLASTNPFLANNPNSGFIATNFQQSSLVQGMSSLQMNSNQVSQTPLNGSGNTQTNLNWFSGATENSVAVQSNLANPFIVESASSNNFDSRNVNLFDNANIASIAPTPNPLLTTINSTAPKEANLTNLNSFW